jgi:hypothetical protein
MTWQHSTMAAAVGNNLPRTVAGDNDAVEWFLMDWNSLVFYKHLFLLNDSNGNYQCHLLLQ